MTGATTPTPAPAPPPDPELARATLRKTAADADTAELNARLARQRAAIGDAAASGMTGAVEAGEGAALAESNFLARRCIAAIVDALTGKLDAIAPGKHVYLSSSFAPPALGARDRYAFELGLATQALDAAVRLSDAALDAVARKSKRGIKPTPAPAPAPAGGERAMLAPLTTAGLVLAGAGSLLSYARSDFKLGGLELKPNEQALLAALAGKLVDKRKVRLDGMAPRIGNEALAALVGEVSALQEKMGEARTRSATHAETVAKLTPPPVLPGTTVPEVDPEHRRPAHEAARQALEAAVAMSQGLLDALTAPAAGPTLFEQVATARALAEFLGDKDATLLVVQLDGAWASTLSNRNLWSGLFNRIPYWVSATIGVRWWSFEADGLVLRAAGTETYRTPLQRLPDIGSGLVVDVPSQS